MVNHRAPSGPLMAALAAAVLAISVFLPWYGVSITASGVASARQEIIAVAQHYGKPTLQSQTNHRGAQFDSLVGRPITTVSAYQSMERLRLLLLGLAGIALLMSLLRFADMRGQLHARGSQIAFVGAVATVVVIFRMLLKPRTGMDFVSLSLSWGSWIALLGGISVTVGGLMAGAGQRRKRKSQSIGPGPPRLAEDVPFPNR